MESFLQAIKYRITDGSDYGWHCYGVSSYALSVDNDDYSATCVFDTATQELYDISMVDYNKELAYKWINPLYYDEYKAESIKRGFKHDMAMENVEYFEVHLLEDIIEKITALCNNEEYNADILVPFDIPDDLYDDLVKMADEQQITINELIKKAIMASITKYENSDETSDNLPK